MATFITRLEHATDGIRLAVKDLIDIAGVPTTAGSRAVADTAMPASTDAPCLAGARLAGAAIVGKVNLHELAYGAYGVNRYFGTPVNPLDPDRVPGGSSSGSAVAVADGDADIAYGSDTGGSIRIPAAFCGVTGLKTTHGRISLDGVWPLAPSLDTVGPMALDVAGVAAGMTLLEPGFAVDAPPAGRVGRVRPAGIDIDPDIDAAIENALIRSGLEVVDVDLPEWQEARDAVGFILDAEAAVSNRALLNDPVRCAKIGDDVRARLSHGTGITAAQLATGRAFQPTWRTALTAALCDVDVLALPTVAFYPPLLSEAVGRPYTALTNPVNLSGFPALALPVPSAQRLPASLQLIGPSRSEAMLLATGAIVEATAGYSRGAAP
jgi:amidase